MTKLYVQSPEIISMAAPYDRLSGQGALVGTLFGIAMIDILNTIVGPFNTLGVHVLPKATGALAVGALVYWDNTAKNVTATTTSNTRIGCAVVAAASGDATVTVRLNGQACPTGA